MLTQCSLPTSVKQLAKPSTLIAFALIALMIWACGSKQDPAVLKAQSEILIDQGHFQQAAMVLRQLVALNPNDPALRLSLADAYLKAGDGAAAESAVNKAKTLGAEATSLIRPYGESWLLQKKFSQVVRDLSPQCAMAGIEVSLWCRLMVGKAQLGLANYDPKETLLLFVGLFAEADQVPEFSTALDRLRSEVPLVEGGFQHASCGDKPAEGMLAFPEPADSDTVVYVGRRHKFKKPSEAASAISDDTWVMIEAQDYVGDVAVWSQSRLIIQGINGRPHIKANGASAQEKGTWVFQGRDITVRNVEMSGAVAKYRNGAAIRMEGIGLTVSGVFLHHNQNGILTADRPESVILVEDSEFATNGSGDGLTHNLYIGDSKSFTLQHSYSHDARIGHQVKSRARLNRILYNRLMDGESGNSSYLLDIPDGGETLVMGNVFQQSYRAENRSMLAYGAESKTGDSLSVINNTFYNQALDAIFVHNHSPAVARVVNNLFGGAPGIQLSGSGELTGNLAGGRLGMLDPAKGDFHLSDDSLAIDAAIDLSDPELLPAWDPSKEKTRKSRPEVWRLDVGAHEFCGYVSSLSKNP